MQTHNYPTLPNKMKLINNQDTLLFDELCSVITEDSAVYICVNYFSIPALFELNEYLNKAKSIQILIDNKNVEKDIRFSYDQSEWISYFDLKSKYKAEKIKKLIDKKVYFRSGAVGGQKFILIKNKNTTACFTIVPYDLNLHSLGVLKSGFNQLINK